MGDLVTLPIVASPVVATKGPVSALAVEPHEFDTPLAAHAAPDAPHLQLVADQPVEDRDAYVHTAPSGTIRFDALIPPEDTSPANPVIAGARRLGLRFFDRATAAVADVVMKQVQRTMGFDLLPEDALPAEMARRAVIPEYKSDMDEIRGHYPVYHTTTPRIARFMALYERGMMAELVHDMKSQARRLGSLELPICFRIFGASYNRSTPDLQKEWILAWKAIAYFAKIHNGWRHMSSNGFRDIGIRRGIVDCDAHLFASNSIFSGAVDNGQGQGARKPTTGAYTIVREAAKSGDEAAVPCHKAGQEQDVPEGSGCSGQRRDWPFRDSPRLEKIIRRLPFGSVFADFGGGYGLMAYEAHQLRPDLKIYVNDMKAPEDWYDSTAHRKDLPTPDEMRQAATYLTGDALTTALPEGQAPALITAVSLSQYLPDALKLTQHLYLQLAIGGILLITYVTGVRNVDKKDGPENRAILDLAAELRAQGVRVEVAAGGRTLAIERPDTRRLEITATLFASPIVDETIFTLGDGMTIYYHNPLYRVSTDPAARYARLVP